MEINILDVLDQMDSFRRRHYRDEQPRPDYYMRALEAILARAAGFESRTEWTSALKETNSEYARDLLDSDFWGTF